MLTFRNAEFDDIDVSLTSDNSLLPVVITMSPKPLVGAFGSFIWGSLPWGGEDSGLDNTQVLRKFMPRNHSRAHWVNLSINFSQPLKRFSIQSVGYAYSLMSTRFTESV